MWADEEKAVEAFRTGNGIPWGDHNGRLFCGVAGFYRNAYKASLVSEWLPALDGVVEKLKAGAKVADIGCGYGHSTVLMAEAFPVSRFHGFDGHAQSIAEAKDIATEAGVARQAEFVTARADNYPGTGYDLICFFDALHDMGDPVAAATHAAKTIARDGTVMLVEPFANDRVEDNISPVAQGGLHALPPRNGDTVQPDPGSATLIARELSSFRSTRHVRASGNNMARTERVRRSDVSC
jgi:ubiquinone/menaquinone biosynthesis C-methylase UbiE